MTTIVFMAILLAVLVLILFALIILVGFAYLQIKTMEQVFQSAYENNFLPDPIIPDKDRFTQDFAPGEVPLENFTPDFNKPVSLKFTDTEDQHGVEEVTEQDER